MGDVTATMRFNRISDRLPPVSALSLGSWNTFSRLEFEDNVGLIRAALDAGVNLFDVGYYWDKPHTEVIFGRALQVIDAPRDDYLIAQKLWLWSYPGLSLAQQLEASLIRLGLDRVDLVMVSRPRPEIEFEPFVAEIEGLISRGLARAWGVTNWEAGLIERAQALCAPRPGPALVQLQYNVARRAQVENEAYRALFATTDVRLCAAFVLEGGILGGHTGRDRVNPSDAAAGVQPHERNIARDSGGIREIIRDNQDRFEAIARSLDATPAQVAIAFALANPATATALIGVSRPQDLVENLGALSLVDRAQAIVDLVTPLAIADAGHPRLFDPVRHE